MGNVNGDAPRTATVDFSFLEPGRKYKATIYADAPSAHYRTAPQAYITRTITVTNKQN